LTLAASRIAAGAVSFQMHFPLLISGHHRDCRQTPRLGADQPSNHLLERKDRLLASDEERRDHVRKYDDVAQRQHRTDSGLTRNEWWSRLGAGHGSSPYCRRDRPVRSHDRAPMGLEGKTGRRSDIRAQRAGMIPCLSSQNFIRLREIMIPGAFGWKSP